MEWKRVEEKNVVVITMDIGPKTASTSNYCNKIQIKLFDCNFVYSGIFQGPEIR